MLNERRILYTVWGEVVLELDLLYALRATFAANDIHLWLTGVLTPPPPPLFTCRIGYCRLSLRFNNVSFCEGAGVRLGGWEIDGHQYGQNNSVSLHRNQTYSKRYCPIHALTTRAAIEEALLFFLGGGLTGLLDRETAILSKTKVRAICRAYASIVLSSKRFVGDI